MSDYNVISNDLLVERSQYDLYLADRIREQDSVSAETLAASITKAANQQVYYTIRFLVDRDRTDGAYRAYAYFRCVDDWLDGRALNRSERMSFVQRQQALIDCGYQGDFPHDLTLIERMLVDLIRSDQEQGSGLEWYIRNMMAVMTFDAERRGRLISQLELTEYSRLLSTAVTEALHYFIGHDDPSPQIPTHYLAVTGAHITHMLRDTFEDVATGYFNIPCEYLDSHELDPRDVSSDAYRGWVKSRVELARTCFRAGKDYLAQVKNVRCRIAGYAYTARFEDVLTTIENDGCQLRPEYPERTSSRVALGMSGAILSMMVQGRNWSKL